MIGCKCMHCELYVSIRVHIERIMYLGITVGIIDAHIKINCDGVLLQETSYPCAL